MTDDSFLPSNSDGLLPLYSLEAEMSTLGSMLLSERAAEEIVTMLGEDDFYRPAHRHIFRAITQLVFESKPVDFVTVVNELAAREQLAEAGGAEYLVQMAEYVVSPANSTYYAQIVLDKATLRRLESAGRHIVGIVRDPDGGSVREKLDKSEQRVFDVAHGQVGTDFKWVKDLAYGFFVDVDKLIATRTPIVGLTSGFSDLDRVTTGFYPGDLVIIGARPSMGKTSLMLDFTVNAARKIVADGAQGAVAFFTLEMSDIQITQRLVTAIAGVSSHVLKTSKVTQDQYQQLADACDQLYDLPIYIDESSDITPLEMRAKCRRLKSQHGLSLVVIDYLQLMRGSRRTDNRVQEISDIARGLKAMAKELGVPVITGSQLSRTVEHRDDKRPQLSDLRESGSIEAEADMVMLLYRDSYYKAKEEHRPESVEIGEVQQAEIIIAKHRNGPTGKVMLGFQPSYARFVLLDRGSQGWDEED